MVKAQQAERAWNAWYLQQSSAKATVPMAPSSAYQGKDKLPAWAISLEAAPAAPITSVGGVLRPNPAQPAVQSKPKAVVPKISISLKASSPKARLPMPKRPLQTNVEDELPSWAKFGNVAKPAQPAAAKAIDKPVLVTEPVVPTKWIDQPEPHAWQRFVNNATFAYLLYRPATKYLQSSFIYSSHCRLRVPSDK
eukprot:6460376-Amphidinium_carterae.1